MVNSLIGNQNDVNTPKIKKRNANARRIIFPCVMRIFDVAQVLVDILVYAKYTLSKRRHNSPGDSTILESNHA
jgi:hypothetical protein